MPLSVQNALSHLTNDKLSLNSLKLKDEDMEAVVKVINQYHVLYVDLSHNDLTMLSMYQLGAALAENQSVILLNLSHNKINSDGAAAIGSALQRNGVLQTLNMSHNPIQNLGACALVYPLSKGQSALSVLDIANCHIGSEGITFFAKLLASNIPLCHLKLAGNSIGKLEGIQLSYALLKNRNIRSLDLSHCRLIPVVGSLMLNILARSQSMESFDGHGNNGFSDDALNKLALRFSDNQNKRKQAECEIVLGCYPDITATTILGYMGDYESALTYIRNLKKYSKAPLQEGAEQQVGIPLTLDQDAKVKQKKINL